MTTAQTMTYNPAFLGDEALIAGFAVRGRDLAAILEIVQDNTTAVNQHVLVIGSRGIGKTTLALRVAAELRRTGAMYPIVFAEESYEVHDAATLWLQALYHLGRQTGAKRWQEAHERLLRETDPARVRNLALAELHEFAEAEDRRLLVVIENFNALVDRQVDADEAWTLRHTLLNDPSIMLLATATSRFDGIDRRDQAMFDLFRVFTLDPLASHECAALWHGLTGRTIGERQGRALEILTGGNPRLLSVMSRIAADAPLHSLADDLLRLIDQQTAYFKSQIDALSPQAQRVFVALADLWSPSTAQEIAERARMSVSNVSAVLARLEQDGFVAADAISRRRKRYQLSERLYNLYYQLRRGGPSAQRARYSIEFIAAYYDAETLVEKLLTLAEDAANQPPELREEYITAFFSLYDRIAASHAGQLLPRLSPRFQSVISDDQRGRLVADLERARADLEWFHELWREWWRSHRTLDELWSLIATQPVAGACWAEMLRLMRGETAPPEVGPRLGEQVPALLQELEGLRPSLHARCRVLLQDSPSTIDALVIGVLAAAWFYDDPLFIRAWGIVQTRWPESPWVQLMHRCFNDFAAGNHPRRFIRETKTLLARHPDSVWLPLAAGLVVDIEEDEAAASSFYRSSPLSGRVVELARTLLEIHDDLLEFETIIVTEPRFARFADFVVAAPWIGFFVWLGGFTADRLARPADALQLLRLASDHFPESVELQLALGSALFFHAPEHVEEGLAILRRASKHEPRTWRTGVAIAAVLAYPLGQIDAALHGFATSWRDYSAEAGKKPSPRDWLEPASATLPGHPFVKRYLLLIRPTRRRLEADLKRLLADTHLSRERHQKLINIILALAIRGDARTLLDTLRRSPAAASLEPFLLGLAMIAGEETQAPHEIAEPARDIAALIRVYAGMYRLTGGSSSEA